MDVEIQAAPVKINDEIVLAVMDIHNHEFSENMPERHRPTRELSVVTIAETGYYNVWYLSMHDGKWSENAAHYSHAHSYEKALIQSAYQATEYTEH